MQLGAFSISLAVKDLKTSEEFYSKLGFERTGGNDQYAILCNGTTLIGLFQGMFDDNILTFNPGLTNEKEVLKDFTDVRELRDKLLQAGLELTDDLDPSGTGPAHITLKDPDGNSILIDQHFPKP